MHKHHRKHIALFIGALVCALPLAAHAQRKSPLADAPAIRKRLELRSTRFEFGAGAATTLGQDFYHDVIINVKAGFHIVDWLSLSGFAGFGVAAIPTGFRDQVVGSLDTSQGVQREPTQNDARSSLNKISQMFGAQVELTPFTGKYSLFGKLFAHYDFYAFAGPGFVNLAAVNPSSIAQCSDSNNGNGTDQRRCLVSGMKIGANFGVGVHSFINDFIALNLELRDMLIQNNAAGRDVNGDGKATSADLEWESNYVLGLNIMFLLPATAGISN